MREGFFLAGAYSPLSIWRENPRTLASKFLSKCLKLCIYFDITRNCRQYLISELGYFYLNLRISRKGWSPFRFGNTSRGDERDRFFRLPLYLLLPLSPTPSAFTLQKNLPCLEPGERY